MEAVKMWGRGQLTIPAPLRREFHLDDQTVLNVFKVGDVMVLTPKKMLGDRLAKKAARHMEKSSLSLEDLLKDLERERGRYNKERYGL